LSRLRESRAIRATLEMMVYLALLVFLELKVTLAILAVMEVMVLLATMVRRLMKSLYSTGS
jgi:hypothetical protein